MTSWYLFLSSVIRVVQTSKGPDPGRIPKKILQAVNLFLIEFRRPSKARSARFDWGLVMKVSSNSEGEIKKSGGTSSSAILILTPVGFGID